jgi:hypothetical protein
MTTTKTTPAPTRPKPTIIHPVLDMARNVTGSDSSRYPLKGPSVLIRSVIVVAALTACGGASPKVAAKDAVVTCAKVQRGALIGAVVEIGLMFYRAAVAASTSPIDTSRIEDHAVSRGAELGGCAFAKWVEGMYKPQETEPGVAVSALMAAPDPAMAALERVRARLGGVKWDLGDGATR